MKRISLIVCDSYPIIRDGLRGLLARTPDIEVVADVDNGDAALEQTAKLRPNVLITDVDVAGCSGQLLLRTLKRTAPQTAVLVMTGQKEEHFAAPAFRAGAKGYISKRRPSDELVAAVRRVAEGQLVVSPELAHRVIAEAFGERAIMAPHENLTPREQEVFRKLAQGRTVGEIARRLNLSPKTVSTHKVHIFKKLKLDNVNALVRYAIDHGML